MKYKIGDKVRAFQSKHLWRQPLIGRVGMVVRSSHQFDWAVQYDFKIDVYGDTACWNEEDLELAIAEGEQLLFDFMLPKPA
jgi:hypothetical protein